MTRGEFKEQQCPMCAGDTANADGEWSCPEAPGFCSLECRDWYLRDLRRANDAYARELREGAKYAQELRDARKVRAEK